MNPRVIILAKQTCGYCLISIVRQKERIKGWLPNMPDYGCVDQESEYWHALIQFVENPLNFLEPRFWPVTGTFLSTRLRTI